MSNGKATFVVMQPQIEILKYVSPDFDLSSEGSNYQLIIDGTLAREPFLAFFENQNKLVCLLSYSEYQEKFPNHPIYDQPIASVFFLVPALDLSLIPAEVYNADLLAEYNKTLLDDGVSESSVIDFKLSGMKGIYRENLLVLNDLLLKFPQAQRRLLPHIILENLQKNQHLPNDSLLGLHVMDERILFYLYNNQRLLYINDFKIVDKNELNYYFIKISSISGKDITQTHLLLSGNTSSEDWIFQEANKYFASIQFMDSVKNNRDILPDDLNIQPHQLYGLLSCLSAVVEV